MSQWNNSYVYNNQYQAPNNWNGDMNGQFVNQAYYARPETGSQYVSFNEFLNQMQTTNPVAGNAAAGNAVAGNAASYNNAQYENYPTPARQFNYQNLPSTSQTQLNNYNYASVPANIPNEGTNYPMNVQNQYNPQQDSNAYTSEMILNSNLTPTATEFVPKCSVSQASTSIPNIPEATNSPNISNEHQTSYQKKTGGSSSDRNWRERPQNLQPNDAKETPVLNGYSQENGKGYSSNNRNREAYHRNNENNGRQYENNRNQDGLLSSWECENSGNQEPISRNNEPSSSNNEPKSRGNESSGRYNESNGRNNESNGRKNETSTRSSDANGRNEPSSSNHEASSHAHESNNRNYEPRGRNYESGNRNYESTSRNHESTSRNQESNSRNQDSRNYDSSNRNSNRNYESNSRNQEFNRNQDASSRNQDLNSRNYESNNRNERRNNPKGNSKFKSKDADNRTFYNSTMPKEQDVRSGRGEGSGRNRNWVGSQRLRGSERNVMEDEQFASSYSAHKEERIDKERAPRVQNLASPVRLRNKQHGDQGNKEMTQRERLSEQLDKGALECLVCCDRVKQMDPVWSCSNCYHVLHLRCIRKWAMSSTVEGRWRCPACQNTNDTIPTDYRCMCGAMRAPEYNRGSCGAHTCGKSCKRPRSCPHPCTLLCHPGPCPACQATVAKQCGCGAETRSIMCSSKLPQVCGRVCSRTLECGVHKCAKDCHEGPCDPCAEMVEQVCYCPSASPRSVLCSAEAGAGGAWACGGACGRVLACGAHVCRAPCHAPPCAPCRLLPAAVPTCPCGKMRLPPGCRVACTDPIPVCAGVCARPLPCGPATDRHFCKLDCHEGPCPECPDKTLVQCRCGHSSREVFCVDLPEMINNVLCQKKCNKKLSCGRHRCRTTCCAAGTHRCAVPCGRSLACGLHRCEDFCHTGHCAPCPRVSFSELPCSCGAQVVQPPVRCGTRPPPCEAPCRRRRACGHAPLHNCHSGDCPPCVVLTTKRCHGNHEERKTIPCSQEEFSCGLPCGKPLPCGKHTCIKTCHKGPCDTGKCTQPCNEKRPSCGHPCAAPCHAGAGEGGAACPSAAPCRRAVRAVCACARRSAERACHENARDYAKMMSALAATKMHEGGSVDLSEVNRPGSMLKTLECDDECRVEARTRQLALALQIRNPDVSAKLAPRYNENLRGTAGREPAFAQHAHDALTDLVQRAKKSKQKTRSHSFPSMNWQKRQFIHELCEHFGCESVAYDAEPNRNVVATADREKSWLPAMSVLEVLAREAGKRRVPGPVLRAPPAPAPAGASAPARSSGWATLTSSNAWAARSAPRPPEAKIDYFDHPPDN
uniref:Shuttle craft n=1 Tax=Odontopera bidentata TaxID=875882 RepID=A0A5P8NA05_9NEOP|nr:shuttle craft [Odontopera bidentata]